MKKTKPPNLLHKVFLHPLQEKLDEHLSTAKYQRTIIHALKEVQGDENIVGFYQTTSVPMRQSLIESQTFDHERLRQGGIVVVHGNWYDI